VALALCAPSISILAQPTDGKNYRISFVDVDGNALSTFDGRVTTLVLTSQANIDKARGVGDRTPDSCLGNSRYLIADFDGTITSQLGAQPASTLFHVFIFGRNGELLRQWNDVPKAEELSAALKQD
jgi:hypothetical protein